MKVVKSSRLKPNNLHRILASTSDSLLYSMLQFNQDTNAFDYGISVDGGKVKTDFTSDDFDDYRLASPSQFINQNGGVCWDFVIYEANQFEILFPEIEYTCWFVCFDNEDDEPTHTFITFRYNDMTYYLESSFGMIQGVWCAESDDEIISFVLEKMDEHANGTLLEWPYYVFKYDALDPNIPGMNTSEFMNWMFNNHKSYRHEIDDYDVMELH